jgi:eukaryotic-like serine/threonine-protein kinase
MIRIPGGTFDMGSPKGAGNADGRPEDRVRIKPFQIDLTEVTVAQYAACVAADSCPPAPARPWWRGMTQAQSANFAPYCNASRADRANYPENCVTWIMANDYCYWIGGRLPTEEEWEYAARGTDGRIYPWGNAPPGPKLLNACGPECNRKRPMYATSDGWAGTAPVASYPAGRSPFGLYDMAGNVWEWTSSPDCPHPNNQKCTGQAYLFRGGGWWDTNPSFVRATARGSGQLCDRAADVGFRCVRVPVPPTAS